MDASRNSIFSKLRDLLKLKLSEYLLIGSILSFILGIFSYFESDVILLTEFLINMGFILVLLLSILAYMKKREYFYNLLLIYSSFAIMNVVYVYLYNPNLMLFPIFIIDALIFFRLSFYPLMRKSRSSRSRMHSINDLLAEDSKPGIVNKDKSIDKLPELDYVELSDIDKVNLADDKTHIVVKKEKGKKLYARLFSTRPMRALNRLIAKVRFAVSKGRRRKQLRKNNAKLSAQKKQIRQDYVEIPVPKHLDNEPIFSHSDMMSMNKAFKDELKPEVSERSVVDVALENANDLDLSQIKSSAKKKSKFKPLKKKQPKPMKKKAPVKKKSKKSK